MAQVATSMKLTPSTLLTKGKERLARRLHSITLRSTVPSGFTLRMICMLYGPLISNARASFWAISLSRARSSSPSEKGGSTSVASPECTPAFSTCSETAWRSISPLYETASMSISCASGMNLVSTTGYSVFTSAAMVRLCSSVDSSQITFIAAPEST